MVQGTSVTTSGTSARRKEDEEAAAKSESFIYIRDILFILADRSEARPRALASNDTATLIASPASPILSPVPTLSQPRLRHALTDVRVRS